MIQATLVFIFKGEPYTHMLLGYKKRGFAQGKIDGFGGKLRPGESLQVAAVRELMEETSISVATTGLQWVGVLSFFFPYKREWEQEVHVFIARDWQGDPSESEEMRPEWFPIDRLPYDRMWDDASYWMPHILGGEKIRAIFTYGPDNEKFTAYSLEIV